MRNDGDEVFGSADATAGDHADTNTQVAVVVTWRSRREGRRPHTRIELVPACQRQISVNGAANEPDGHPLTWLNLAGPACSGGGSFTSGAGSSPTPAHQLAIKRFPFQGARGEG